MGLSNTATGADALSDNTNGHDNVAVGNGALSSNTQGSQNTATGSQSLNSSTSSENTADGFQALFSNTTGDNNTGIGRQALLNNTSGADNTAVGRDALANNTIGSNNIALGVGAGVSVTTGDNNIDIGNGGGGANTIHIGNSQTATLIAGISGVPVTGTPVTVSVSGQLGVAPSSQRFKDEIKPMDKVSEAVLALRPVTFRYRKEIDPARTSQFGLVAEEVEKVNPDLIVRDKEGKAYSVRYDQVNAMLLNEFLKEHRKVEELQAGFAQQQKDFQAIVRHQQEQIDALTAGLQKVTAQLEVGKPAQQTVLNNQ